MWIISFKDGSRVCFRAERPESEARASTLHEQTTSRIRQLSQKLLHELL